MVIPPPTDALDDAEMRWYVALWAALADPPAVTALQVITGLLKAGLGVLLFVHRPDYLLEVAGGVPLVFIAFVLTVGGALAAFAAWRVMPTLEEFGLRLAQVGLAGLFTVFAMILRESAGQSFLTTLLALVVGMAVLDAEKRIRRLRWDLKHPLRSV